MGETMRWEGAHWTGHNSWLAVHAHQDPLRVHLGEQARRLVNAAGVNPGGGAPLVLLWLAAHAVRVRVGEAAACLARTAAAESVVQTLAVLGGAETKAARKRGGDSEGSSDNEEGLHVCGLRNRWFE